MKGPGICSRKEEEPIKGSGENAPVSALRLPPEECGEEKRLYKKERDTKSRTPISYRLNGVLRAVSESCLLSWLLKGQQNESLHLTFSFVCLRGQKIKTFPLLGLLDQEEPAPITRTNWPQVYC